MRALMWSVAVALAAVSVAAAQMPAYPPQQMPAYQAQRAYPGPLYLTQAPAQSGHPAPAAPVNQPAPLYQAAPVYQAASGACCGPNVMDSCEAKGCGHSWYLSFSGGWAERERVHEVGTNATFLTFDSGFNLNAAVGHRFGDIRVEGEFSFLNTPISAAGAATPGGNLASAASGNISIRAYMFNLYYDLPLGKFKPYVGGGIGFYQSEINSLNPAFFGPAGLPALNTTSNFPFAYQLRAGVSYEVNSKFEVFGGYRYFDGSTLTFSAAPFGTFQPNGAVLHSVEGGVRIKF